MNLIKSLFDLLLGRRHNYIQDELNRLYPLGCPPGKSIVFIRDKHGMLYHGGEYQSLNEAVEHGINTPVLDRSSLTVSYKSPDSSMLEVFHGDFSTFKRPYR